jgi:hypothetical protein
MGFLWLLYLFFRFLAAIAQLFLGLVLVIIYGLAYLAFLVLRLLWKILELILKWLWRLLPESFRNRVERIVSRSPIPLSRENLMVWGALWLGVIGGVYVADIEIAWHRGHLILRSWAQVIAVATAITVILILLWKLCQWIYQAIRPVTVDPILDLVEEIGLWRLALWGCLWIVLSGFVNGLNVLLTHHEATVARCLTIGLPLTVTHILLWRYLRIYRIALIIFLVICALVIASIPTHHGR